MCQQQRLLLMVACFIAGLECIAGIGIWRDEASNFGSYGLRNEKLCFLHVRIQKGKIMVTAQLIIAFVFSI